LATDVPAPAALAVSGPFVWDRPRRRPRHPRPHPRPRPRRGARLRLFAAAWRWHGGGEVTVIERLMGVVSRGSVGQPCLIHNHEARRFGDTASTIASPRAAQRSAARPRAAGRPAPSRLSRHAACVQSMVSKRTVLCRGERSSSPLSSPCDANGRPGDERCEIWGSVEARGCYAAPGGWHNVLRSAAHGRRRVGGR